MIINFPKWLSVLANILALVIFMPGIALAIPLPNSVILTQSSQVANSLISSPEANFTPQERQQIQALRQRRNKEIKSILNSSQSDKLKEKLQAGDNINQALESLDLHPDQQSMIKAVMQLTNLKMKGILARHSLQIGQEQ